MFARKTLIALATAAAALVVLPGCAVTRGQSTVGEFVDDTAITTAVKAKLLSIGDTRAGEILDIILRDEIGHVSIGNRWYGWLCAQRSLDPVATYAELTARYQAPRLKRPFNLDARRAAGFSDAELSALQAD